MSVHNFHPITQNATLNPPKPQTDNSHALSRKHTISAINNKEAEEEDKSEFLPVFYLTVPVRCQHKEAMFYLAGSNTTTFDGDD